MSNAAERRPPRRPTPGRPARLSRHRQARTAVVALGLAVIAAAMVSCGGGGGGATVAPGGPTVGALQASQPGQLLAYAREKLRQRQQVRAELTSNAVPFITLAGDGRVGAAAPAGTVAAATAVDRSGTTVQEQGVDEDDVLKSDGALLVALAPRPAAALTGPDAELKVHRRGADGQASLAGTLALRGDVDAGTQYRGLYLAANARAAVLGESQIFYTLDFCAGITACTSAALLPYPRVYTPKVVLDIVSLVSPAAPAATARWRLDGRLVGSRLIGQTLVLVTQHAPNLPYDLLPWNAPAAEREAVLARLTADELLPTLRIDDGAAQPLVAETDCYVEPKNASYGVEITTVTTIDLSSSSLQRRSRCFIGGSEALYMSASALYLATTTYAVPTMDAQGRVAFPPQITTDVHKFALGAAGGGSIDYRGTGTVSGHLGWDPQSRSYRFSEHNGDLRVLTYSGSTGWIGLADATAANAPPPSPATLTILRERAADRSLQVVSTLPNSRRPAAIGKPGEQVYAVRFVGDRGYVVTFRRIDPLYVLDLADPADPKTLGELTTAGFSSYLFPVGPAAGGLLLGVGHDADDRGVLTGVKVALFDVADPTRPVERGSVTLGGASTQSALDVSRHGIDLLTRGSQVRVVLPMLQWSPQGAGQVFSLQRFELDTTARSLTQRQPLSTAALGPSQWLDLSLQRTLQVGELTYHWDGEQLRVLAW